MLMVVSSLVIVPTMIASGLLFGPRSVEGIFLAPLAVITVRSSILYWMLGRKTASKAIAKARLGQLAPQAETWLDGSTVSRCAARLPAREACKVEPVWPTAYFLGGAFAVDAGAAGSKLGSPAGVFGPFAGMSGLPIFAVGRSPVRLSRKVTICLTLASGILPAGV